MFGQKGKNDAIEMNGGYTGGTPKFEGNGYTTKGSTLLPPEVAATELLSEAGDKYEGRTIIVLEGNKMTVTPSKGVNETLGALPRQRGDRRGERVGGLPLPLLCRARNELS